MHAICKTRFPAVCSDQNGPARLLLNPKCQNFIFLSLSKPSPNFSKNIKPYNNIFRNYALYSAPRVHKTAALTANISPASNHKTLKYWLCNFLVPFTNMVHLPNHAIGLVATYSCVAHACHMQNTISCGLQ